VARGRTSRTTKTDVQPLKAANGFEATLWASADKLRGNMDAAEYKHVALGLIFLKYISESVREHHI
jgi:type I restriction enzyme M protein